MYSNIYIAPLQGNLLRGALCAGLYDVKCRYKRIFSVSAKIKHSKLKESLKADPRTHVEPTNRFPADRWVFRVSLPGYVARVERRLPTAIADTGRCRRAVPHVICYVHHPTKKALVSCSQFAQLLSSNFTSHILVPLFSPRP